MAETSEAVKSNSPGKALYFIKIGLVLINFIVLGVGFFFTYRATLGWTAPAVREELEIDKLEIKLSEDAPPLIYTMDKFTVNLDGIPKRTVQIEVNLHMLSEEGFEEVLSPSKTARARDKLVRLFGEKQFDELETVQGKLFLKDMIAREVNSVLDRGVVRDVYFSSFVVQ